MVGDKRVGRVEVLKAIRALKSIKVLGPLKVMHVKAMIT